MDGYRVTPMSRKLIRDKAFQWRKTYGMERTLYLPIPSIFEILPIIYPELKTLIDPDDSFSRGYYAETDISRKIIRLSESTYNRACNGDGFSRMTVMHEVGHYEFLVNQSIKCARRVEQDDLKPNEDPEWQAKCFAGEIMIPKHLVENMTPEEISINCGVSLTAAFYQYNIYKKEKRQDKIPSF